ncbi:deoxyribonuclease V [Adhaeribacter aquaticus]|uniref:deoxyribonuclease V n=1 Tax=Adhaeribacter aquaticus TaxID=299567 RepID=UPI0003F91E19|nr:deoxyribonuclease V [Adhaeribacter aquaticus]
MYYRQHPPIEPSLLTELTQKQQEFSKKVIMQKPDFDLKIIAGCDSSFIGENILSVFVLLSFPDLKELEIQYHYAPVTMPYVPGFLSFREAPNLLLTYEKLQIKPDLIMVDGHGISHPRRLGIASHLGIHLNIPTMGLAKEVLAGKFTMPDTTKGSVTPVIHRNEHIANAIRTKDNVKPVFASPGHLMDLETATEIAFSTTLKHKLPEPTRLADHYSKTLKKEFT